MKKLLEFFLNILLWFFYYHTTVGATTSIAEINYHNFTVNTVIFSVPYIFSGVCLFCKKENKIPKKVILVMGGGYVLFFFSFFSCILLEFILQGRTPDDLILGIPGLIPGMKLDIDVYARCMLIFPILNNVLEFLLDIAFAKGETN